MFAIGVGVALKAIGWVADIVHFQLPLCQILSGYNCPNSMCRHVDIYGVNLMERGGILSLFRPQPCDMGQRF